MGDGFRPMFAAASTADYWWLISVVVWLAVLVACLALGTLMSRAYGGEAGGGGSAFGDDGDLLDDDEAQGGLWG